MSYIHTLHRDHDRHIMDKYKAAIFTSFIRPLEDETPCKGSIGPEFIYETLNSCEYLIIHQKGNSFHRPEIFGFVCVNHYLDSNNKNYLYVDLICNNNIHHYNFRSKSASGKSLLNAVNDLAKSDVVDAYYIKLSAIESVITYYWNLGYRFPDVANTTAAETKVNDLLIAQNAIKKEEENIIHAAKNKDDRLVKKCEEKLESLKKISRKKYEGIIVRYTKGFLADSKTSKVDKIEFEKEHGIYMVKQLKIDSPSTTLSNPQPQPIEQLPSQPSSSSSSSSSNKKTRKNCKKNPSACIMSGGKKIRKIRTLKNKKSIRSGAYINSR